MTPHIERHEFFQTPGAPTLRYSSHWPSSEIGPAGFLCGCTRSTDVRPAGDPAEVQNLTEVRGVFDGMLVVYSSFFSGFSIYPGGVKSNREELLYAWVSGQRVQFQYSPKDREDLKRWHEELLLAPIYVGQPQPEQFDTMMNGHSPSRLDLSGIQRDTVWMHACCWGHEAFEVLPEPEAQFWRDYVSKVNDIQARLPATDTPRPLDEIAGTLRDPALCEDVACEALKLVQFFRGLRMSKTWEIGRSLAARVEALGVAAKACDA